jgi:FkbM family methyltransferase
MAKILRSLLRKSLFGKRGNLISLDDPFSTMNQLLEGRPVRAIVDAGGSDGRVSRRLLEWFPESTVYAFEPNPAYEDALNAFAAIESRFKPQFCALANVAGKRPLHVTRSPGATSFYQPSPQLRDYQTQSAEIVRTIEVPTARLDDWAQKQGLAGIDVIKLDVQGGELGVLEGAGHLLDQTISAVYTEVLFNPLYDGAALFGDLDRFLRGRGFALFNLYGPKSDRHGVLLWANAIYTRADPSRLQRKIK